MVLLLFFKYNLIVTQINFLPIAVPLTPKIVDFQYDIEEDEEGEADHNIDKATDAAMINENMPNNQNASQNTPPRKDIFGK